MKTVIESKLNIGLLGRTMIILLICVVIIIASGIDVYADECSDGGEHEFEVELIKQASNTEDGLRKYTCKKCGYTYDEVIENFGHRWEEWHTVVAPTCESTGVEERHCANCTDFEQRSVAALDHDWGEWREEGGKEVRECKRDPSHREERAITVVQSTEIPEDQDPVEEEPEEPVQEIVAEMEETEPELEPEKEPVLIKEPETPDRISWMDEWTPANTAVATGGGFIIVALGALMFTTYISPWLWVLAKRRKKREEVQRSMYA